MTARSVLKIEWAAVVLGVLLAVLVWARRAPRLRAMLVVALGIAMLSEAVDYAEEQINGDQNRAAVAYERGDFVMAQDGRLTRRGEQDVAPFVYAGAAVLLPSLFAHAPKGEFPLTKMFERAAEKGRLFGVRLEGLWMHVGTPDAIAAAEGAIKASAG